MIFDFHAHPTFKPFNSRSIYDEDGKLPDQELWKERFRPDSKISKLPKHLEGEVNYTSQIHLNAMADGNLRGMCVSFYPLERVFTVAFTKISDSILFGFVDLLLTPVNWILKKANAKGNKARKFFFKVVGTLTGYDPEVIEKIHGGGYHYYKQMVREYNYMVKNQDKKPKHGKIAYEIATDFDHYNRIIQEGKIAYILSVEGSNAFLGNSTQFDNQVDLDQKGKTKTVVSTLSKNIENFKSQQIPPFIITLAHHQYNFICGHAPSFIGIAKFAFKQEGKTLDPANPSKKIHYYLTGIKPDGKRIIREILSKNVGNQRTLIDTKHMSAKARMDYRDMIFNDFAGEDIPIIQTHTGVNGRKKMEEATGSIKSVELRKGKQKKSHFFTSSINLFDDEIVDIIRSNGLIGIMLDEKRIIGKKLAPTSLFYASLLPNEIDGSNYKTQPIQKKYEGYKDLFKDAINAFVKAKKQLECKLINSNSVSKNEETLRATVMQTKGKADTFRELMENVFISILGVQFVHIAKVYKEARSADNTLPDRDPWDHICIGSDYEGVINPLDIYFYSSDLVNIENRLTLFFTNAYHNPQKRFAIYRDTMEDNKFSDYAKRIVWENSQWFLERYFNSKYLK